MPYCIFCGSEFYAARRDSKYCSVLCIKKAWKLRNKNNPKLIEYNKNYGKKYYWNKLKKYFDIKCRGCGKEVHTDSKQIKFCSLRCRLENYTKREDVIKKNRLRARERRLKQYERVREIDLKSKDTVRYGGNRIKTLERDGYMCVLCNNSDIKSLVVHHWDGTGQDKKPNNEMENLATICKSCHAKLHKANLLKTYSHQHRKNIIS